MTAPQRLAQRLRFLADRIDHHGAPKCMTGLTFTFEQGIGMVIHKSGPVQLRNHDGMGDLPGCRLWYYGDDDYEKAHSDGEQP